MRRRDFMSLAGMSAMGASWQNPLWAAPRGHEKVEDAAQEDPRFREISRLIEAKAAEYRVPGVAFGVLKNGSLAMRGFGITNLDNPQPVTTDTVFPIASITKTIVSVALLRLAEQGRVDLFAPVREYLPRFRVLDEAASRAVTLWHLLTHTPGWEGQLTTVDRGGETHAHFTDTMADKPQYAPPGEMWSYNNAGFVVAGRVIEVVTGSTLYSALHEIVFGPLGLDFAFTRLVEATSFRLAAPHTERDGRTVVARPFAGSVSAAGCGLMSMSSLMAYARFHLGDGTSQTGEPILGRAALELMRTPQLIKRPTTDEMGVGWHLRRLSGVLTAVHGGSFVHQLHVQLIPERSLAFALQTNHSDGWRLNEDVASAVLELYEDLALAPNQRTGGNRGGNERMDRHAEPLAQQPPLDEYVGYYDRSPVGARTVRRDGGQLLIETRESGAFGVTFFAPDMAFVTAGGAGAYQGSPVEFIRDAGGDVRWLRINGRISRRG